MKTKKTKKVILRKRLKVKRPVINPPENMEETLMEKFLRVCEKWLILNDTTYIEVLFAAIYATTYLDSKPIWLHIVGPPSSGKTVILQALDSHPLIYMLSTLTEKALISGMIQPDEGKDPSLLPKLNGKILVIKDFTPLLKERRDVLAAITGQFRDSYDGKARKSFGTGKDKEYTSRFGIVTAVTPEIDKHLTALSALGERFLIIRLPDISASERTKMAMKASGIASVTQMEKNIQKAAHRLLNFKPTPPELPDKRLKQIEEVAAFVAKARTHVDRSRTSREILYPPVSEIHIRLHKQLCDLAKGLGMVREKKIVGKDEVGIIQKVALDGIPGNRINVLRLLSKSYPEGVTNTQVGEAVKISRTSAYYWLDDLYQLGIVRKIDETSSKNYSWRRYKWILNKKYAKLLCSAWKIEKEGL
ncbi:MAG: hypothetical protein ACYSSI_02030 [Planctomycetota bacterium]|jgi:DNA-binding transcriptional ArsR family regulator